jgi:NAD kinase
MIGQTKIGSPVLQRPLLCCNNSTDQIYDVLNELVIDRGPNAFLTNIECYEKGRFITRVQADGIMLSTPTGRLRKC